MTSTQPFDTNTTISLADRLLTLPAFAAAPINRCNLPAVILGGLTYQHCPTALHIDMVQEFHARLFTQLDGLDTPSERAQHFRQYMNSAFLLSDSEQVGFSHQNSGIRRDKADYLRLIRGWMFDANSIEAAVIKRWVESRFGLLTLNHKGVIYGVSSDEYQRYLQDYVRGLYNSNALESQLDLLYTYCQYELIRQMPKTTHLALFRGVNGLPKSNSCCQLLLNNINSCSDARDQASIFGDHVFSANIPTTKILYFPDLLPNLLRGEREFLVIGGMVDVQWLKG